MLPAALLAATSAVSADWSLAPTVNLQYDWAMFDADVGALADASDLRRLRTGFVAKRGNDWELKVEHDFNNNQWTDAYLRHGFSDHHGVRVGQFKQAFLLDELTSDRVSLFMEQGLPAAFGIARRLGGEYAYTAPNWSMTLGAYGQTLEGLNKGDGIAGRLTWLPIASSQRFLHLAVAAADERPDAGSARFSTRPEAALSPLRFADTGNVPDVDGIRRIGVEAAWIDGPWMLQSEYVRGQFRRAQSQGIDVSDFDGSGYYIEGSWFASGHGRGYKNGVIDGPKLADGRSAWELGLRYSQVDLDDADVRGGVESNWTLGVTWWAHPNLRLIANAIAVDSRRRGIDDDPRIVEFRVQLNY